MIRGVYTVYRKELLDTLRDRKTLVFMLLLPTLFVPLLSFAVGKFAVGIMKKSALQEITIAATPETQEHYREIVHEHFILSEIGRTFKIAKSPVVQFLVRDGIARQYLDQIPNAIFDDPEALQVWAQTLAEQADEALESRLGGEFNFEDFNAADLDTETVRRVDFEELSQQIFDFYFVTIQGLGLVRFVDPDELSPARDGLEEPGIPTGLKKNPYGTRIAAAIRNKDIQGYLEIPQSVNNLDTATTQTLPIRFFHDSSILLSAEANSRVHRVVEKASHFIVQQRIVEKGYPKEILSPIRLERGTNLVSTSQIALSHLGALLPYLLIPFAFIGGIYPAIDIGAGEKERNTLETLLLSPVSRTEIALGKFFLIFTTSMVASILGVGSMVASVYYTVPSFVMEKLDLQVQPTIILLVAALAVPPAAAFSGLFLSLSIFARSFKEAQSYLSPLPVLFILPAAAGMIPGLELNWKLALIPLVNMSLLSRDFLKGDINWIYYGETVFSCLAFATVCIVFCVWMFRRESVLFRS